MLALIEFLLMLGFTANIQFDDGYINFQGFAECYAFPDGILCKPENSKKLELFVYRKVN